jgi:two-component system, chemotaxis family, sensor kinase CheA
MSTTAWQKSAALADKIALELVFASAGKDDGLLPVNSLLGEIEDAGRMGPFPEPLAQAVALARKWLDGALDEGCFSPTLLSRLASWTAWMQAGSQAAVAGQSIPGFPEAFTAVIDHAAPVTAAQQVTADSTEEILKLDTSDNGDLLREFIEESKEHLQQIELGVLALEDEPTNSETLNSIFRSFHTLKGGSGFLNLAPINKLAHELESLLDLARQQKLVIHSGHIDLILSGADALKQCVAKIEQHMSVEGPQQIQVSIGPLVTKVHAAIEGGACKAEASLPSDGGPAIERRAAASAEMAHASSDPNGSTRKSADAMGSASSTGFVKVNTTKLDSVVDLVGEMMIAQAQVCQDPELVAVQSQKLARNLAQLRRITSDLQKTAMSLRMVPIRSTFQKMTRLVRDLSAKAGKQVELRMSGEETEVDRNFIEELNDPLVHMIRNAVDHGIEKPEVRRARGKPETGQINLRAFHQGGNVVIEIQDDGAGLNKDRILAKAIERGLVAAGQELSDKEIFGLVFAPGFSTAERVTEISGRGVGMDVVRRNIEALRGKIDIQSAPERGSTFAMSLPLTLAIIDGLVVSVGAERFILPTLSVKESFRPNSTMLSTVQGRGEMVTVRGQIRPLLRLHELFELQPESSDPTNAIIVVIEANGQNRCLLVDRLLGKQEVVIKGLGEAFKQSRSLAGAAILGDGRVGLILDVHSLVRSRETKTLQE